MAGKRSGPGSLSLQKETIDRRVEPGPQGHALELNLRGQLMAWLYILLADVFEVAWPFVLKWSVAFSRWSPLIVAVFSIPVMFLLGESVKRLPAATVYAAFVGIGTAGTATVGMAFFGESANAGRVCCLLLILIGVMG
jgi:quaternary ammonium compound-resistance protein SugE